MQTVPAAGIGCGVPAKSRRAVNHVAQRYGTVERLSIDLIPKLRSLSCLRR